MAANVLRLDVAVARFAEKLAIAPAVVVEKLAVDLHTKISRRNPVDTGLSRSRWTIREGEPDNTPYTRPEAKKGQPKPPLPPPPPRDPPGGFTGTEIVYITNNVNYVEYLEQGSSQQAPSGMIKISVIETEAEVAQLLQSLTS